MHLFAAKRMGADRSVDCRSSVLGNHGSMEGSLQLLRLAWTTFSSETFNAFTLYIFFILKSIEFFRFGANMTTEE